jgi:type IV pilus assembly protein PilQ
MSPIIRTGLVAVFAVGALTLTASAASDPARAEQSKRETVRAALQQQGRLEAANARVDAASSAAAVEGFKLDVSGANPALTIETVGQPSYKAFAIKEESKIVIDLANTVNLRSGAIPSQDEAVVKRVRTSLFALEPEFVSRVVIDLAAPCAFEVHRDGEKIVVKLNPAAASDSKVVAEEKPNAQAESKVAEVCAALESVKQKETAKSSSESTIEIAKQISEITARAGAAAKDLCGKGLSVISDNAEATARAAQERAKIQQNVLLAQVEKAEAERAEEAPRPSPEVASRVDKIANELESVQASQYETTTPPVRVMAIVETQTPPPPAPPASESTPPAAQGDSSQPPVKDAAEQTPAKDAAPAEQAPAPAPEQPAQVEAQPTAPEAAPAPPEKREPAPAPESGEQVMNRMKELLSNISAAAKGAPTPGKIETSAEAKDKEKEAEKSPEEKNEKTAKKEEVVYTGDPMNQIVNIDFRDMDLTNVVALLAQKAQINVIAGANLNGAVTASLKNVTLRQAIETVLRMNNLGVLDEEGIYRIVPYQEAMAAKRKTIMVKVDNAKVSDIRKTLEEILKGSPDDTLLSLSENDTTNMLIIAGPETRVMEFERLAKELDIAKPVTPTITEAIKLNNAEPSELSELVKSMLSKDIGKVAFDARSRHLVITDSPLVLDQVRELIKQMDMPVKQVSVDSMIVDAVLSDASETGVDWVMNAVHKYNLNGKQVGSLIGPTGGVDSTGDTIDRDVISDMTRAGTGFLSLGLLTDKINIKAAISAQVDNRNATLLANPVVVTVENQKASINISEEIPYQESKQSVTGPPMTSTNFKDIGVVLEVTPKVTHDDHVLAKVMAKQSRQDGVFNNIPIEAKRSTETTLRSKNGQTIFIGGLRRFDDSVQSKKVPVLGDIPVMNFMFRNNVVSKQSSELLVFLTCTVLPDEIGALDDNLQKAHDQLDSTPKVPDAMKSVNKATMHPKSTDDPAWHWRRSDK